MKIASEQVDVSCPEPEMYNRLLTLDNKHILELGCGAAIKTRNIATTGANRKLTALEVDEIAHQKNLQITDLPNVTFVLAGAQDIPLNDDSVDVVFMFKSLHHVPLELMEPSMQEIRRVLKPGGLAYISEPIFSFFFNEILRLFHDEQKVREAAFSTIKSAVDEGLFTLLEQNFFNSPTRYENFAEFENKIINATHSHHALDDELFQRVKQCFEAHLGDDGAHFFSPVRVDLLQKPAGDQDV